MQAKNDEERRFQGSGGLVVQNGPVDIGKVGVSAYLSANQTIPHSTVTTVAYDGLWNSRGGYGGFDTSTGVYTVQSDGDYHIDFLIDWFDDFSDGHYTNHSVYTNGSVSGGLSADENVPGGDFARDTVNHSSG